MLTNLNDPNAKPKVPVRRSSLKNRNINPKLSPLELLKIKQKRNSISWGQIDTFKFKENNPTLEKTVKLAKTEQELAEEKHKKFLENRRRSIQNEYQPNKIMMDKSKELVEEIINEELKKNMENNKKVGKEAIKETDSSVSKSDSEKKKSSKNNSKGSRSSSKSRSSSRSSSTPDSNCSCSSCQRRRNQSNQSKSESKSESESEKNKKKKKKKEVRIKFNVKKDNEKPKKETGTKKLKGKLKKVGKNKEYKKEEEEEKEEKEEEKEVEKEEEKEVKKEVKKEEKKEEKKDKENEVIVTEKIVDRNIRLISYKEAKELDLDKVAYIALTDGSILIVRKEYGLKSQGLTQKTIDNSNENSIINKSDYLITETIGTENEQNFNNMNNFQQPNKINLKIKKPNFHQILFETEVQRPQQTQSNYPKSEYSYNGQIYSSNITLPNSNMNRSKQYNNNYNYKLNTITGPIWKERQKLLKKYQTYNPKNQYTNHNHSVNQKYLIQPLEPQTRQFIQIKSPKRQLEQNNFKVIEAIPYNYDNYHSQIIDNSQSNLKYVENYYPEMSPYEPIIPNDQYMNQRQQNFIYSPIKSIYSENNYNTFDQDLNE